ncbi:MAG: CYTH domain-containing protein [Rhodospirillales bacterium]|nr:CYTH domain-containing protein [Rhodospirillales bacterium]
MAAEIERKFLVTCDAWRSAATGESIRQGYLWSEAGRSLRVRIAGEHAFLTLKSGQNGCSRQEYEYEIPLTDAGEIIASMCNRPLIEKTRYTVVEGGIEWVIDEFEGENAGLVVAEVELDREDEQVDLPLWAGCEVTAEPRYLNANLVARPYRLWTVAERMGGDRPGKRGCP